MNNNNKNPPIKQDKTNNNNITDTYKHLVTNYISSPTIIENHKKTLLKAILQDQYHQKYNTYDIKTIFINLLVYNFTKDCQQNKLTLSTQEKNWIKNTITNKLKHIK